jgi:hypothetical protein
VNDSDAVPFGTARRNVPSVQLVHICGRNLARVYHDNHNPTWTADELVVSPNQNVAQDDYRPWPHGDADADWHARTYTWHCRCGKTVTRRHSQISRIWEEFQDMPYRRGAWRVVLTA